MAVVSPDDRRAVRHRDGERCVSCGRSVDLTMQHRAAVGAGGTSFRVGRAGLLTACGKCNPRYEHDLQTAALAYGWKIRTWVLGGVVPVFYLHAGRWAVLAETGKLRVITTHQAARMMRAAYGRAWDQWVAEEALTLGMEGVTP